MQTIANTLRTITYLVILCGIVITTPYLLDRLDLEWSKVEIEQRIINSVAHRNSCH